MFEKSVGGVIFRKVNNKIYYLLLHYEAGHWDFPKGHIEKGETEIDTLKREVKEETGIKDLKIINGFKEYIKYFFRSKRVLFSNFKKSKGKTIFKLVIYYLAQTKTKEIKLSFEHIGCDWLLYKDALSRLTFDNAKNVLKKAHQFLKMKYKISVVESEKLKHKRNPVK